MTDEVRQNPSLELLTVAPNKTIHKTTMTPSAITLYSQCCRRHLVGQRVEGDIHHFYSPFANTVMHIQAANRRHDNQMHLQLPLTTHQNENIIQHKIDQN